MFLTPSTGAGSQYQCVEGPILLRPCTSRISVLVPPILYGSPKVGLLLCAGGSLPQKARDMAHIAVPLGGSTNTVCSQDGTWCGQRIGKGSNRFAGEETR